MPLLSRLRRLLKPAAEKVSVIPAPLAKALSVEERTVLRDWLRRADTQLALSLLEARHPGTMTSRLPKVARSEWDQLAAVNFLHRISGWESYRNALLRLPEPDTSDPVVEDDYPEQD